MGSWSPSGAVAKSPEGIGRFLDTVGDGSGDIEMLGDYSGGGIEEFFIAPTAGEVFVLHRMIIQICDAGIFPSSKYGFNVVLANGIRLEVQNQSGIIYDLLDGQPVKTNSQWERHSYDVHIDAFTVGDNHLGVNFVFAESGSAILLRGDRGEKLVCTLNDDYSDLTGHVMKVHGYKA